MYIIAQPSQYASPDREKTTDRIIFSFPLSAGVGHPEGEGAAGPSTGRPPHGPEGLSVPAA
jgi:hypothetical protein